MLGCETATIGHFREAGFVDPAIRSILPQTRIAGTAVTLSMPPTDGTLLNHVMRLVRPGDVLAIDRQGDRRHACWGGVLPQVAKRLGIAGIIIDGMATDAVTIKEQEFPVWSRGLDRTYQPASHDVLNEAQSALRRPPISWARSTA